MEEKNELKVAKSYSLDPAVIAWVTQKAARLTIQNEGERASDSKVVNDILTAAMEEDKRAQRTSPIEKKNKQLTSVAA